MLKLLTWLLHLYPPLVHLATTSEIPVMIRFNGYVYKTMTDNWSGKLRCNKVNRDRINKRRFQVDSSELTLVCVFVGFEYPDEVPVGHWHYCITAISAGTVTSVGAVLLSTQKDPSKPASGRLNPPRR